MATDGEDSEERLTAMRAYPSDIPRVNIIKQKLGIPSQQGVLRFLLDYYELEGAEVETR